MMLRALVEGLFGVQPDLLAGQVTIKPGFPVSWDHAAITHPDFSFSDTYAPDHVEKITFTPHFAKPVSLRLILRARLDTIASIRVNGQRAQWKPEADSVGLPQIEITAAPSPDTPRLDIEILWDGNDPAADTAAGLPHAFGNYSSRAPRIVVQGQTLTELAGAVNLKDPQGLFLPIQSPNQGRTIDPKITGPHTFFVQAQSGSLRWWAPIDLDIRPPFELTTSARQDPNGLHFQFLQ